MDKINITSNEAGQRLDRFLRKYLKEVSLSDIYKLLRKKSIRVNGRKAAENYRLNEGDTLEIHIAREKPAIRNVEPAGRDFTVIYEDENILVADKPPELILHPDARHKGNTLVDQVLYYLYEKGQYDPGTETTFKPAAVNRLDLNTGGIVLFAKNYISLKNLSEMVRERYIEKRYICIVNGDMKGERDIRAYLTKDSESNVVSISETKSSRSRAIHTRFHTIRSHNGYSLVEVKLITGRSHQIRAQLADLGYPIIGDKKYGDPGTNKQLRDRYGLNGQFLYAYKVHFEKSEGNLRYLEGSVFMASMQSLYTEILMELFGCTMEEC